MSTINTEGKNMFSFGDIPVLIDGITPQENYNSDLGIVYNKLSSTNVTVSTEQFPAAVNVPTKVEFGTSHKFVKNSTVWVEGDINGYFRVLKTGSDYIVINFQWGDSTPTNVDIYNISVFRGSLAEGATDITFNLKNELSNYVSPDIKETSELYPATSTVFDYGLLLNESFDFIEEFEDIKDIGGNMAIINPTITSLAGIPLKVGDKININQNQTVIDFPQYTRDVPTDFSLAFRGANNGVTNQFRVGQTVNVLGGDFPGIYQVIRTDVFDTPGREVVVVNRTFEDNVVVGVNSTLVGNIRPEYDGVTVIKDIFIDATDGLTIVTEKEFTDPSVTITGKFRLTNNFIKWLEDTSDDYKVIWGNLNDFQWKPNNAFEYIIDFNRPNAENRISTVHRQYDLTDIKEMTKLRVNREDYLFGLIHSLDDASKENFIIIDTYDKKYNKIGEIGINNIDEHTDYYFPMALSQIRDILTEPYVSEISGDLVADFNTIKYYEIRLWQSVSFLTNKIAFEISDCSNFDNISINFVDDKGSLLSIPVNLVNREFNEVVQDEFYKNNGKFDNGDWGYGDYRRKTIFNNRQIVKYRLTTDWLRDYDADMVVNMLTSSHKFVTIDGMLIPIQSLNDEVETKRLINDQIFNYTFDVTVAVDKFRK